MRGEFRKDPQRREVECIWKIMHQSYDIIRSTMYDIIYAELILNIWRRARIHIPLSDLSPGLFFSFEVITLCVDALHELEMHVASVYHFMRPSIPRPVSCLPFVSVWCTTKNSMVWHLLVELLDSM